MRARARRMQGRRFDGRDNPVPQSLGYIREGDNLQTRVNVAACCAGSIPHTQALVFFGLIAAVVRHCLRTIAVRGRRHFYGRGRHNGHSQGRLIADQDKRKGYERDEFAASHAFIIRQGRSFVIGSNAALEGIINHPLGAPAGGRGMADATARRL